MIVSCKETHILLGVSKKELNLMYKHMKNSGFKSTEMNHIEQLYSFMTKNIKTLGIQPADYVKFENFKIVE